MPLDDNIPLIRNLQESGKNLSRLAAYVGIGVTPSRANIENAQRWFNSASEKLEPVMREAEAHKAGQRMRLRG